MKKKLYLKPDTEVLDIIFENNLLAGTNSVFDEDKEEYEFDSTGEGGNASDYD